jgi:protein-disulfide isomerase
MLPSRHLFASISLVCMSAFSAHAADSATISREDFESMLRQTLDEKPEIVVEALQKMQKRERDNSGKLAQLGIEKNRDALFNDPTLPSAGASIKDADVTIVEFFDYHCGYCKHMLSPLQELLANDKKVRVVFMEFPILSQDSANAARAAVAAHKLDPKKYLAFHAATMKHNGKFDEAALQKISESAGISFSKLKAKMDEQEVGDMLQKIRSLGEALGVSGTPSIIVGDRFLPGAVSFEELKRIIEDVREEKKGK